MRLAGETLVTVALVVTLVGPLAADWNDSHVFNRVWPGHARFHAVVSLCMTTFFSAMGLVLVWRDSADHGVEVAIAALVPVIFYGSFYLAVLVPGTGLEADLGTLVGRVGEAWRRRTGMEIHMSFAGALCAISLLGLLLYSLG